MKFSRDHIKDISDIDLPAYLAAAEIELDYLKSKHRNSPELWLGVEKVIQAHLKITLRHRANRKAGKSIDDLVGEMED